MVRFLIKVNNNIIFLDEEQEELIKVLEPFEDESFGGYILRVAENNFYSTPQYIYKLGIESSQKISVIPIKLIPI